MGGSSSRIVRLGEVVAQNKRLFLPKLLRPVEGTYPWLFHPRGANVALAAEEGLARYTGRLLEDKGYPVSGLRDPTHVMHRTTHPYHTKLTDEPLPVFYDDTVKWTIECVAAVYSLNAIPSREERVKLCECIFGEYTGDNADSLSFKYGAPYTFLDLAEISLDTSPPATMDELTEFAVQCLGNSEVSPRGYSRLDELESQGLIGYDLAWLLHAQQLQAREQKVALFADLFNIEAVELARLTLPWCTLGPGTVDACYDDISVHYDFTREVELQTEKSTVEDILCGEPEDVFDLYVNQDSARMGALRPSTSLLAERRMAWELLKRYADSHQFHLPLDSGMATLSHVGVATELVAGWVDLESGVAFRDDGEQLSEESPSNLDEEQQDSIFPPSIANAERRSEGSLWNFAFIHPPVTNIAGLAEYQNIPRFENGEMIEGEVSCSADDISWRAVNVNDLLISRRFGAPDWFIRMHNVTTDD